MLNEDLIFSKDENYESSLNNWDMVNVLISDSETIRDKREKYLFKNEVEELADYNNRLRRSWLPLGYNEELMRAVGKVFSYERTIISDDIHPEIAPYLTNLDLMDTSLEHISRQIFFNLLHYGVSGGLVDYSKRYKRPYFNNINPINVIRSETEVIDGIERLTSIHILEERQSTAHYDDDKLKFDDDYSSNVMVFWLDNEVVKVSKYTMDKEIITNKETFELSNEKGEPFNHIPINTCYGSPVRFGYYRSSPVLLRLAENTIRLYNARSDLEMLIHTAVIPKLIIKTNESDVFENIMLGGQYATRLNPEDDAFFLTHGEKSIECGERLIERITDEQKLLGFSSLLYQNTGNITATARALDEIENNSRLSLILGSLRVCINNILGDFAEWKGIPRNEAGAVNIKADYTKIASSEDKEEGHIGNMVSLWNKGGLSLNTLLYEHKRLGFLPEAFDVEKELELIKTEAKYGD